MGIEWALLRNWEHRSLEAMMEALEPKKRSQEVTGPMLGTKLQSLLDRSMARRIGKLSKLERRLSKIQEVKPQKE
jgi:hypothetical protein